MATARTFTAGNVSLQLDGIACGLLFSSDGGNAYAEVVHEPIAQSFFAKKHIGQPKYEDFTVQIGLSMGQDVYDWIAASFAGTHVRKNGSITTADANFNAKTEQQFSKAVITEATFPALDSASKDAGRLTIKFSPEFTRFAPAGGKVPIAAGAKQKPWLVSNFRLELDGLDCKRVTKIDSFTIAAPFVPGDVGSVREPLKEQGRIDFPDLRVTMTATPAPSDWDKWFEDFVLNGKNDDSQEKSGAIVFLGPDMKAELGRIVLHNVGIYALRRAAQTAADKVQTVTASLYCERMELVVGKPAPVPQRPIRVPDRQLGIRG